MARLCIWALVIAAVAARPTSAADTVITADPGMAHVRGGPFWAGISQKHRSKLQSLCFEALPNHLFCRETLVALAQVVPRKVVIVPGFWIDKFEVSIGEYRRCVRRGKCSGLPLMVSSNRGVPASHPVTGVLPREAQEYCETQGARLPTELEWEKAATGKSGRAWPWGNDFVLGESNLGRSQSPAIAHMMNPQYYRYLTPTSIPDDRDGHRSTHKAALRGRDVSHYGVYNLGGNVSEWVRTTVRERPRVPAKPGLLSPSQIQLPKADFQTRGGAWNKQPFMSSPQLMGLESASRRHFHVGFRCAQRRGGRPGQAI